MNPFSRDNSTALATDRAGGMPIELDTQLELALEGDSSHEENFAFGTALALAPNPGVQIDNLGLLSLPMTPSDVEQVKSAASGAPFGHMERPVPPVFGPTVRDTWEIDASRITLRNPEWNTFLNGIADTVCKGLDVAPFTDRPECELYKLLLYEKGPLYVPALVLTTVFAD